MKNSTIALLATAVIAGCGDSNRSPEKDVTAIEIYEDYVSGNVAGADSKYLNKVLRVSGAVLDVEPNGPDYAIGIASGPNVFPDGTVYKAAIYFEFDSSSRDTIAKIKNWDQMVIVGKCRGMTKDSKRLGGAKITFTNSRIESHKDSSAK